MENEVFFDDSVNGFYGCYGQLATSFITRAATYLENKSNGNGTPAFIILMDLLYVSRIDIRTGKPKYKKSNDKLYRTISYYCSRGMRAGAVRRGFELLKKVGFIEMEPKTVRTKFGTFYTAQSVNILWGNIGKTLSDDELVYLKSRMKPLARGYIGKVKHEEKNPDVLPSEKKVLE